MVEFSTFVVDPNEAVRAVLRKSHDLRFELEHNVDGIEPFKAGLDVRDSVWMEVGNELGGVSKLLFVKYLFSSVRAMMSDE